MAQATSIADSTANATAASQVIPNLSYPCLNVLVRHDEMNLASDFALKPRLCICGKRYHVIGL